MHVPWLVEDFVIPRYNHLARSSREMIIAGALNFKMAASRFVSVTRKRWTRWKKIPFQRAQKNATGFGGPLYKRKIWSCLTELNKTAKTQQYSLSLWRIIVNWFVWLSLPWHQWSHWLENYLNWLFGFSRLFCYGITWFLCAERDTNNFKVKQK